MQSVDEAGHKPAAALRTFSRQGNTVGNDDQAAQAGSLPTFGVASSRAAKLARKSAIPSTGTDTPVISNLALEVGRDGWILSGKIRALPVKHINLLAGNTGYSAEELDCWAPSKADLRQDFDGRRPGCAFRSQPVRRRARRAALAVCRP